MATKIAVIGAGEMGHGIAELAALRGYDVTMRDIKQEYLDRGMERVRWSLDKLVEKNQIKREEAEAALARIRPTLDLSDALRDADFAIEAVFEDLGLKKRVFRELDGAAPDKTILASNTSAIPITSMAVATKRPEKVVGLHFFNPPMLMPLIEVVRAEGTSDATLQAAVDLSKALGKTVVVVRKDVPGFITTRILGPYFEEAAWIHEDEGVSIETIDAAMRFRAGFPMGPFELADQVGIDVLYHLIENAKHPVPMSVKRLFDANKVGRKVGEGFYSYKEGRPKLTPELGASFDPVRILAPMINEAADLLAQGVASAEDIDLAMRLGTAFPKGPLATADDLGVDAVLAALRAGKRHAPAKILDEMAARGELGVKSGKGFYDHVAGKEQKALETLLLAKDHEIRVATITINRPDRLNTLSPQVFDELEQALAELERDEDVRCVVITGAGERSFSAGADLTSFTDISKAHKVWQISRRSEEVFHRLANFPKPTVAALNGYAYGGGLELALACDFRLAARRAKVGQTEIGLGLVPGAGGSQRLVRVVGLAKAKELVMMGSRLTADEAAAIGLLTKVADNEAFGDAVRSFAERLAKQAPIAIRLAKALLNRSGDVPIDAALEMEAMAFGLVTSTEDIYEGLQAFMEKREPKFKGE
ncbi:MAG TPA: enoyl-CoA hydratase-related protein [Thermoplasmata archaeon]|jgi:enoyl-CoA hydratase/3-hydroxyacyl-CoA dehydrogenase